MASGAGELAEYGEARERERERGRRGVQVRGYFEAVLLR